jgi:hypothetical protein
MSYDPNNVWYGTTATGATNVSVGYGYGQPFYGTSQTPPIVSWYPPQAPPEVKRTSKELRVVPSLKGFKVYLTDLHGNTKDSEYSEEELTKAMPDLLAKLKREPKEE